MKEDKKIDEASGYVLTCMEALRKTGARVTKARKAVIAKLAQSNIPLSTRDIFEEFSKGQDGVVVDKVSIYRILDTLLELGLVHQVFPSGGYLACFHQKCDSELHVLIRCKGCEQIQELDVPEQVLNPIIEYLSLKQEFEADKHLFQMNGFCKKCQ